MLYVYNSIEKLMGNDCFIRATKNFFNIGRKMTGKDRTGRDKTGRDDEIFDLGMDSDESSEDLVAYDGSEILPESPTIRGNRTSRHSNIHGKEANFIGGRSVSPPLFAEASNFPECTQMRVWKMENGQPVGLGTISSTSNEEDLIDEFRSAMPSGAERKAVFKIRPLDINGQELGQEFTKIISAHHASLKVRASNSSQSSSMGNVPSEMIGMLKQTLEASQRALEEERRRTQLIMQQVAQERIDLANQTAQGVQTISERMMQADAERQELMLKQERERNRQAQDNMASFFQSNIEIMQSEREKSKDQAEQQLKRDQTFYERMMEREAYMRQKDREDSRSTTEQMRQEFQLKMEEERLRREREREEWDRRRLLDKEEFERKERVRLREIEEKRARDSAEKKELESIRQREHEMRLREMELQAQRDREHQERMMQLQMLATDNEKAGSAKSLIKDAVKTMKDFGIEPKDLIDRLLNNQDTSSSTTSEVLGAITNIAGSASEVLKESIKAKNATNEAPFMPPQNRMMLEQQNINYPNFEQAPQPQMASLPQEPAPVLPQKPQTDMTLFDQRRVRKALRNLVQNLKSNKPDKWSGLITESITSEFLIFKYCQDVSVEYAIKEAGGNENMAKDVIERLKEHPLVPEDMKYYE